MNRLVLASGTVLAFAFVVAMQGCSSSDSGSGGSGNTGNTSSAGTGNTSPGGTASVGGTSAGGTAAAGTSSVAGTSAGGTAAAGTSAGGTAAAGTSSVAGTSAGGTAAAGTSAGGTAAAGTSAGGTSAGGTSAGGTSAGGTSAGGTGGATTMPTTACTTEKKGDACVAGAGCAKTCGVKGQGATKSETCGPASTLVEGMCTYPAGTYTCYAKPATPVTCAGADPTTMAVTSGAACTAADCMPCGPYADSTATVKVGGLCTCTAGKWACASATEWPPQM